LNEFPFAELDARPLRAEGRGRVGRVFESTIAESGLAPSSPATSPLLICTILGVAISRFRVGEAVGVSVSNVWSCGDSSAGGDRGRSIYIPDWRKDVDSAE